MSMPGMNESFQQKRGVKDNSTIFSKICSKMVLGLASSVFSVQRL